MKLHALVATLLVIAVAGCATNVALTGIDTPVAGSGTLHFEGFEPHVIDITLDGKRYRGEWASKLCTTDACGAGYTHVLALHRRHIAVGQAALKAEDGSSLECEWISHFPKVDGKCHAQDGRQYSLNQPIMHGGG